MLIVTINPRGVGQREKLLWWHHHTITTHHTIGYYHTPHELPASGE